MSSGGGRKLTIEDVDLVQRLIEQCIQQHMSLEEVVETLRVQANIEPNFVLLVWEKLVEQNQEFFKAYNVRLELKNQIGKYNELLKQKEVTDNMYPAGVGSSISMSDGSNAGVGSSISMSDGLNAGVGSSIYMSNGSNAGVGSSICMSNGSNAGVGSSICMSDGLNAGVGSSFYMSNGSNAGVGSSIFMSDGLNAGSSIYMSDGLNAGVGSSISTNSMSNGFNDGVGSSIYMSNGSNEAGVGSSIFMSNGSYASSLDQNAPQGFGGWQGGQPPSSGPQNMMHPLMGNSSTAVNRMSSISMFNGSNEAGVGSSISSISMSSGSNVGVGSSIYMSNESGVGSSISMFNGNNASSLDQDAPPGFEGWQEGQPPSSGPQNIMYPLMGSTSMTVNPMSSISRFNGSNASSLDQDAPPGFEGWQGGRPPSSGPQNMMHPLMGSSSTAVNRMSSILLSNGSNASSLDQNAPPGFKGWQGGQPPSSGPLNMIHSLTSNSSTAVNRMSSISMSNASSLDQDAPPGFEGWQGGQPPSSGPQNMMHSLVGSSNAPPGFEGGQGVQPASSRPQNVMHLLMGSSSTAVNRMPTEHGAIRQSIYDDDSVLIGKIDASSPNMLPNDQNRPYSGVLQPSSMLANKKPIRHGSILQSFNLDRKVSTRTGWRDVWPPSMRSTDNQSPPLPGLQQPSSSSREPKKMLIGHSNMPVNTNPAGHGHGILQSFDRDRDRDVLPPSIMLPTDDHQINPPLTELQQQQPSKAPPQNKRPATSKTVKKGRPPKQPKHSSNASASTRTGKTDIPLLPSMLPTTDDQNPPLPELQQPQPSKSSSQNMNLGPSKTLKNAGRPTGYNHILQCMANVTASLRSIGSSSSTLASGSRLSSGHGSSILQSSVDRDASSTYPGRTDMSPPPPPSNMLPTNGGDNVLEEMLPTTENASFGNHDEYSNSQQAINTSFGNHDEYSNSQQAINTSFMETDHNSIYGSLGPVPRQRSDTMGNYTSSLLTDDDAEFLTIDSFMQHDDDDDHVFD